jgi:undecaprenyl pyrophosphate synthase
MQATWSGWAAGPESDVPLLRGMLAGLVTDRPRYRPMTWETGLVSRPITSTPSKTSERHAPERSQRESAEASANSSVRHILLVAGGAQEWAQLTADEWEARVANLGQFCSTIGVRWLTLRAYEGDEPVRGEQRRWRRSFGSCDVVIDPCGDGRARFASAMQSLDPADEVNEATVSAALYEPADSEPDLVVIVGPSTQLPPSLVWELAYAELVFSDVDWNALNADDLGSAVTDFSNRRRRFGGLDE